MACAFIGSAAVATEPAERFWGSAAVVHRTLDESAVNGRRLLTETGPLLELRLGGRRALGAGAIAAEANVAGGVLDYDGQTQGGVPLQTDSEHLDAGARFMWRPIAAQPWGEPWIMVGWHHNRRHIASTPTVGGLREISTASLAGLRWQSPSHPATAHWKLRMEVEALVSLTHRLDVDFEGLFDDTRLKGGRQRRAAVRLVASALHSPWDWTLEWAHLNQAVSPSTPLFRRGALAGTVRQPDLDIDDFSVRVTRRF
jgi:hypothetical protein